MSVSRTKSTPSRRISADVLGSAVLLVIGGVFWFAAGSGTRDWLFPRAAALLLIAAGIAIAVLRVMGKGKAEAFAVTRPSSSSIDVAVFIAGMVIYVLLIPSAGFWIASGLMIFALSLYLGDRINPKAVLQALAVTVFATAVGYYLFQVVFFVSLPRGRWFPF